jgi:hypothetical protein
VSPWFDLITENTETLRHREFQIEGFELLVASV